MDHLSQSISRAKRHEAYLFAILFFDLDRFKVINDSLGHVVGDKLLIMIASRLKMCMRTGDTAARLGGDEFVLLDIKHIDDAIRVADRLQEELSSPFSLEGNEVFITASVGITLSQQDYQQPEDLLRDADTAMYRAKELGRARYEIFDAAMHTKAMTRLQLENDLQRAVNDKEFRVYYQLIVLLKLGVIIGFEALVRWQHPSRGLLYPKEFTSVAEETGLILAIDRWVLHEACRQTRQWQEQFPANSPLVVSTNLSVKQFSQSNLPEQIDQILQETDFDGRYLKLEITESLMVKNPKLTAGTFLQLKDRNVQLYLDDFGTGYSSLSALHKFPVDMLKIDRSFVSNMNIEKENLTLTRMIVDLAHNMLIEVTAEGVETVGQLAQLREMKCEYGQGYLFSRAVDSDQATALIATAPQW